MVLDADSLLSVDRLCFCVQKLDLGRNTLVMELANKTAFITGGASGLGLATARNFVAAGANVCLLYTSPSPRD